MLKSRFTLSMIVILALASASCTKTDPSSVSLETDEAKGSYALGRNVGLGLRSQGVKIDAEAFYAGVVSASKDEKSRLSDEETRSALLRVHEATRDQSVASLPPEKQALAQKNEALGNEFIEKTKSKSGVEELKSGILLEVLKKGSGAAPARDGRVLAHYVLSTIDGKVIDSTHDRGKPSEVAMKDMIPGWVEAAVATKTGGKVRAVLPYSQGFGERGAGAVEPKATLVLELEILKVL